MKFLTDGLTKQASVNPFSREILWKGFDAITVSIKHSRQFGRVNMNKSGLCGGAGCDRVVASSTARWMGSLRHINHYPHAHSTYACMVIRVSLQSYFRLNINWDIFNYCLEIDERRNKSIIHSKSGNIYAGQFGFEALPVVILIEIFGKAHKDPCNQSDRHSFC